MKFSEFIETTIWAALIASGIAFFVLVVLPWVIVGVLL